MKLIDVWFLLKSRKVIVTRQNGSTLYEGAMDSIPVKYAKKVVDRICIEDINTMRVVVNE